MLREAAGEVRDVVRAGTPTHSRLRDRLVAIYAITDIASLAGALGAFLIKRGEELDAAAKAA